MAVNAQTYFAANPDVASSYAQNSYGMTPDAFAEFHFKNFGAAESRGGSGVTALQILDYLKATPGLSDAQIVSSMKTYGISPSQMAQAIGIPEGEIVSRVAATLSPNQPVLLGNTWVQANYRTSGSGETLETGPLESINVYKTTGGINDKITEGTDIQNYSPTGEFIQTTKMGKDLSFFGGIKQALKDPYVLGALALATAGATGLLSGGAATAGTAAGTAAGTGLGASTSLGTGLTAGASGLGLSTTGAGLGTLGTGAGITAGTGLGTGVLAGSSLGTGLLGAGALTGAAALGGTTLGTAGTGLGASGLGAGSSLGTGITAGTSGLGLTTTGAGLGATGTGAGITAGTGLTGTGVLTGSGLGSTLLGTGAGALTGTGVLTGSGLGTSLLGTGAGTGVTGGVTGLGTGTLGTGALTTGVGTGLGTTLGTGVNANNLANLLSGGLGTAGSLLQMQQSKEAALAAQQRIDAETAAAKTAAQFRPIGMTTRFGTSQFAIDPVTGQLTSAGYTLSPEAKNAQDRFITLAGQGLTQAEGAQQAFEPLQTGAQSLFKLGQGYLAKTPEDVAKDYLASQMALLQPGREIELANLQNRLTQQGRGGLSVAQGGTMGATTPELQALYNARARQEAELAANAQQLGQRDVLFGSNLLGQGAQAMGQYYGGQQASYAPFTTALGQVQGLEALGQQPFQMGAQLGKEASTAGARVGELGLGGARLSTALATSANATTNPYAQALMAAGNPNAMFGQSLGNVFGGLFS